MNLECFLLWLVSQHIALTESMLTRLLDLLVQSSAWGHQKHPPLNLWYYIGKYHCHLYWGFRTHLSHFVQMRPVGPQAMINMANVRCHPKHIFCLGYICKIYGGWQPIFLKSHPVMETGSDFLLPSGLLQIPLSGMLLICIFPLKLDNNNV